LTEGKPWNLYGVRTAANRQEALDLLQAGPMPNLILLDMLMPSRALVVPRPYSVLLRV
jgi:CheY-like chemotaxis protein